MVKSFWRTLAGHFESFSCCLEQVFSRESVESALASVEKNSKGDVTSGILKTLKVFKNTQDCSLQAYNLLKKDFNTDPFMDILSEFQSIFKKFG